MNAVFSTTRPRRSGALFAVLFLHLCIGIVWWRAVVIRDEAPISARLDVFYVLPQPAVPRKSLMAPPSEHALKPPRPLPAKPEIPRQSAAIPAQADAPPETPAEEKTEARVIDTAALISMAGQLDKQLRKPGENLLSGAQGKSLREKMDEAFRAAHLAVPLKWYEAARVELWSAENDPAKIYQVRTAFGTYCLFYADRLKNPDAPSQPRMSACPKRF
ncbi:hypothetical protein [Massilia sp. YMA4]|uniref:hypothetical protein n=1 Tax=Massilia sp. YMA4 TaxID=1593482 RepID=UPI001581A5EF|nr:hypothetical protein [Massilia sp. YMA4]